MTTLHIIRQSAYTTTDFEQCIQSLCMNDIIVFIDDGCYNLQHNLISTIDNNKKIQLNVMKKHALARGIIIDESIINPIEMTALVALTFSNDRVITWQ